MDDFAIVGIQPIEESRPAHGTHRKMPYVSLAVLAVLLLGCVAASWIAPGDPGYMDLLHTSVSPCAAFPFGTDAMGRDLFRCIWHGGRVSLFIGFFSALISAAIGIVYGTISGMAPPFADGILMRVVEILLSVPELMMILFLQAVLGEASILSISAIIGATGWYSIAKVVRTEVKRLRRSEYVVASKAMGGSFMHILRQHLAPNFISSTAFMVVMNIRSAIICESTLSFLGMGLPLDTISWGGILSSAQRALLTNAWWVIVIPGFFLAALLLSLTGIGSWLRGSSLRSESNL